MKILGVEAIRLKRFKGNRPTPACWLQVQSQQNKIPPVRGAGGENVIVAVPICGRNITPA